MSSRSKFDLTLCFLGVLVLSSGGACSDDSESNGGGSGTGGSGTGGSGTGGSGTGGSGTGGSGGASGTGGSGGAGPTYTVAQVCEMFAAAACQRGAECGLVLSESPAQIVCLDCNAAALDLISGACEGDLSGPKDAADVDRCIANIPTTSCTDVCSDADLVGCEVIAELGDEGGEPTVCDDRCVSP